MSSEIMHLINKAKSEARVHAFENSIKRLIERNGKIISVVVIAILLGILWICISTFQKSMNHDRFFSMLVKAIETKKNGDLRRYEKDIENLYNSKDAPDGIRALSSLYYASFLYNQDHSNPESQKVYKSINRNSDYPRYIRDVAGVLESRILVANFKKNTSDKDDDEYKYAIKRIKKVESSNASLSTLAKEQRGLLEIKNNNLKEAYEIFDEIQSDRESSEYLKVRAQRVKSLILHKGYLPKKGD